MDVKINAVNKMSKPKRIAPMMLVATNVIASKITAKSIVNRILISKALIIEQRHLQVIFLPVNNAEKRRTAR